MSITTEEAETLARQLDANEPMAQDPVAIEFFGDVAAALRSVAADRDAAIARAEKAEALLADSVDKAQAWDAVAKANNRTADRSAECADLRARAEKAEAEAEKLREALKPFKRFSLDHVNEHGWRDGRMSERISDWFGPSDFRRVREAVEAHNEGGDDGGEKAHQDAVMYGTGVLIDGKHVKPEDFYLSIDEVRARDRAREEGEK